MIVATLPQRSSNFVSLEFGVVFFESQLIQYWTEIIE